MSFLTSKGKVPLKPTPQGERLSARATAFGQQIIDLEETVERYRTEGQELQQANHLLRVERDQLREQLKTAVADKEFFQRHWYETRAKLKSSASIILDAMREEDETVQNYRPAPASMRAVQKALAIKNDQHEPAPIPDFLAAGPKMEEKEEHE